jgi:hypothetical protein
MEKALKQLKTVVSSPQSEAVVRLEYDTCVKFQIEGCTQAVPVNRSTARDGNAFAM